MTQPRQYRLSPLDSTGWLFGLTGAQCIVLACAVFASGAALNVHLPTVVIASPIALGTVVAFVRIGGFSAPQQLALLLRRIAQRLARSHKWTTCGEPAALPFLRHVEFINSATGVGIVHDRRNHTVSCCFPIAAPSFLLCDPDRQDGMLAAWGDAITPLAEARSIASVAWHESLAPSVDGTVGSHQLVICLSVSLRKERSAHGTSALESAFNTVAYEAQRLSNRLADCGMKVSPILSIDDMRHLVADRVVVSVPAPTLTLGSIVRPLGRSIDLRGFVARRNVTLGGLHHRTYWIEQWPRSLVRADWMEPLLFAEDTQRTLSVHMQPVSAFESRRRITRSSTKLETDALQRERAGFRVGESHRRSAQHIVDREAELGDGYAEFTYCGLITISSPNTAELETDCATWEQRAAAVGIRIMPLDGRQELGLAAALPLGQSPFGSWQ